MAKRRLVWIGTTGGPHLVVPEKHAPHWEGVGEPSHGRVVQARFRSDPAEPATDYDRACDVNDWMGVIRVGRGRGVVLGDVPLLAACHEWQGRHYILRWDYAPSEAALLKFFRSVVGSLSPEAEVAFRHPGGRLLLLDSSDTPRNWLFEHSAFELPAGSYRVMMSRAAAGECGVIVYEWRRSNAKPGAVPDPAARRFSPICNSRINLSYP
ncbi:Imm21 family immunity protein [Zavarzinella formosa]|uniref:Imm21 family immunity protein n=1 Tax=Zavarzinella formosa TaxID=360055 RepID=UPI0002E82C20|nr:Imm21 family immunity protein [Zavarzinella formosa]